MSYILLVLDRTANQCDPGSHFVTGQVLWLVQGGMHVHTLRSVHINVQDVPLFCTVTARHKNTKFTFA
jgi:hypothetical protein